MQLCSCNVRSPLGALTVVSRPVTVYIGLVLTVDSNHIHVVNVEKLK